ncbi:MAG: hypothetical protein Q8P48_08210 [Deltaproteobacteria bacterium]|nr:hypothetical protein [Deltaproteobacteria bacterium]
MAQKALTAPQREVYDTLRDLGGRATGRQVAIALTKPPHTVVGLLQRMEPDHVGQDVGSATVPVDRTWYIVEQAATQLLAVEGPTDPQAVAVAHGLPLTGSGSEWALAL